MNELINIRMDEGNYGYKTIEVSGPPGNTFVTTDLKI